MPRDKEELRMKIILLKAMEKHNPFEFWSMEMDQKLTAYKKEAEEIGLTKEEMEGGTT